jgi:dihydroceramide fatty acyl 2-hydroxylase
MKPDTAATPTSIRLFRNDFLERLSHVHPITPLLVWAPVSGWLVWRALQMHQLAVGAVLLVLVAGLFTWTLAEYCLHRFLFHYPARSRVGQWLVFLFHGNHHEDPRDKTRLVMPPAGALPIMALIYGLFSLFIPSPWIEPFCAGFIIGYLIYDYIHYSTHHFRLRGPVGRYLKRYHLKHHFSGETGRDGVSSPLWDLVFGTRPPDKPRRA